MKPLKKVLNNGVRVVLTRVPSASVGICILIGTGSRSEDPKINGISHFLEHLVFKGTRNFPTQVMISEAVEGVGGILNAFTSTSVTAFWAKTTPDHFGDCFEVLSDLVLDPLFRQESIESEKGVIIEEIRMKNDNPADEVMELAQRSLWGGRGLGLPVLGSEKTIKGLVRDDIVSYHRSHYVAANTVISIAGDFPKLAMATIRKRFGHLPKALVNKNPTPLSGVGAVLTKRKKTSQIHVAFNFPTFPFQSSSRYALEVISSLLGNGMSSRLFLNVRDKGLAYAVHCFDEFYVDAGAFFTYAGLERERLPLAVKTILGEFRRVSLEKVSSEELEKAKEKIRGPLIFSLEDPLKVAENFGYEEAVFGVLQNPREYLSKVSGVKKEEIQKLSREIFSIKNLSFAAISPLTKNYFLDLLKF